MSAGLFELGEIMVVGAQRRLEMISQNVANLTTSGFRKTASYQQIIGARADERAMTTDFTQGALRATGRTFDIALAGAGFFCVRGEDSVYYTRAGQFTRNSEGRLVNDQGFALQTADGGDVVVAEGPVEILEDGTLLENGAPVTRIGVFSLAPEARLERVTGAYFQAAPDAMTATETPFLRQGMVEGSNVELPTEMVAMMQTMRQAEAGARIVQTYDSLLGQTIATLGRVRT